VPFAVRAPAQTSARPRNPPISPRSPGAALCRALALRLAVVPRRPPGWRDVRASAQSARPPTAPTQASAQTSPPRPSVCRSPFERHLDEERRSIPLCRGRAFRREPHPQVRLPVVRISRGSPARGCGETLPVRSDHAAVRCRSSVSPETRSTRDPDELPTIPGGPPCAVSPRLRRGFGGQAAAGGAPVPLRRESRRHRHHLPCKENGRPTRVDRPLLVKPTSRV
jgi:hypothetical protein